MSRDPRRSRLRSQAEEGAGPFKPVAMPAVKAAVSIGERQVVQMRVGRTTPPGYLR